VTARRRAFDVTGRFSQRAGCPILPGTTEASVARGWHDRGLFPSLMAKLAFIVVAAFVVTAALPIWPHSRRWGLYPLGSVLLACVLASAVVVLGPR
jgi:hypothetical protein